MTTPPQPIRRPGWNNAPQWGSGKGAMSTTGPIVLDPAAPLPSAKHFFDLQYTRNGTPTLHHQAGQFYTWNGSCFPVADELSIRAEVYAFLEKAHRPLTRGTAPFQPTIPKVNNVMDALKAATNLDKAFSAPAWLKSTPNYPPEDILACANGLLARSLWMITGPIRTKSSGKRHRGHRGPVLGVDPERY